GGSAALGPQLEVKSDGLRAAEDIDDGDVAAVAGLAAAAPGLGGEGGGGGGRGPPGGPPKRLGRPRAAAPALPPHALEAPAGQRPTGVAGAAAVAGIVVGGTAVLAVAAVIPGVARDAADARVASPGAAAHARAGLAVISEVRPADLAGSG